MYIVNIGEFPGVLIEGKLHSKAEVGEERYLLADRMVWKGLRGITAIFDSILLKNQVYFAVSKIK